MSAVDSSFARAAEIKQLYNEHLKLIAELRVSLEQRRGHVAELREMAARWREDHVARMDAQFKWRNQCQVLHSRRWES
jgi:hypothetical protein